MIGGRNLEESKSVDSEQGQSRLLETSEMRKDKAVDRLRVLCLLFDTSSYNRIMSRKVRNT